MKKINSNGFVLAETLVVTVFLMVLFSMIYSNFYPLIGEYEKRETYDDVDSKYAAYWIKKIIEDGSYNIKGKAHKEYNFNKYGYVRFECADVEESDAKRLTCTNLVKELEVAGCDKNGNGCEIYITKYQLKDNEDPSKVWFKNTVKEYNSPLRRYQENCQTNDSNTCKKRFIGELSPITSFCVDGQTGDNNIRKDKCKDIAEKKVFNRPFREYLASIADFNNPSINNAKYRVIISFRHRRDNNDYYSFATIEVRK